MAVIKFHKEENRWVTKINKPFFLCSRETLRRFLCLEFYILTEYPLYKCARHT